MKLTFGINFIMVELNHNEGDVRKRRSTYDRNFSVITIVSYSSENGEFRHPKKNLLYLVWTTLPL